MKLEHLVIFHWVVFPIFLFCGGLGILFVIPKPVPSDMILVNCQLYNHEILPTYRLNYISQRGLIGTLEPVFFAKFVSNYTAVDPIYNINTSAIEFRKGECQILYPQLESDPDELSPVLSKYCLNQTYECIMNDTNCIFFPKAQMDLALHYYLIGFGVISVICIIIALLTCFIYERRQKNESNQNQNQNQNQK